MTKKHPLLIVEFERTIFQRQDSVNTIQHTLHWATEVSIQFVMYLTHTYA